MAKALHLEGETRACHLEETARLSAVWATQARMVTLSGQIQATTAQLLEALAKAWGSSAGGRVNTQA